MRAPLVILAALSLFFVYSPDPLDGAKGWFMKMIPTPATVVGAANPQKGALLAGAAAPAHEAVAAHGESAAPAAGEHGVAAASHGEAKGGHNYSDPRQAEIIHAGHAAHYTAIYISSAMVLLGVSLAFLVYVFGIIDPDKTALAIRPLYLFSLNKWYWDEIYQATFIKGSMALAKMLTWFDINIVDGIVNGVATLVRKFAFLNSSFDKHVVDGAVNFTAFTVNTTGAVLRKLQTGKVQTYVVMLLLALVGYFAFYLARLIH